MAYVVYLTTYYGNKLPPFYIGSTSEKRLSSGYNGSVTSKKYKKIWDQERSNSPNLFRTKRLSRTYKTYHEAQDMEANLQLKLNVVKSEMFINMAIAQRNGCFGRDVSGKNHPLFGKGHSLESRQKISKNHADCSGNKNGRASRIEVTSPAGEVTSIFGEFKQFCLKNNLPYSTMNMILAGRIFTSGKCVGWKVKKL